MTNNFLFENLTEQDFIIFNELRKTRDYKDQLILLNNIIKFEKEQGYKLLDKNINLENHKKNFTKIRKYEKKKSQLLNIEYNLRMIYQHKLTEQEQQIYKIYFDYPVLLQEKDYIKINTEISGKEEAQIILKIIRLSEPVFNKYKIYSLLDCNDFIHITK